MKLIAKTRKGTEFFHSKKDAFFVANSSANKICRLMNDVKYRLQNQNEIWYVYDYDFTQDYYVEYKVTTYRHILKIRAL